MGSSFKEEIDDSYSKFRKIVKTFLACVASFLISMIGGLILLWWEIKYHPENRQLWMVPFGLIIFVTPIIVWFSSFVSDFCCPKEQSHVIPSLNQPDSLELNSSVRDIEQQ